MESSEVGSGTGDDSSMSAQSLFSTLGLSSDDIEALAKIPEKEITVETLPFLIMQLKAKRAESAAAATDTDCSEQTETNQPEEKEEPSEKSSDRSPDKCSELKAPSLDQEDPEKNDEENKAERPSTGGKKEDRDRKSSKERQREEECVTEGEIDDKPTNFPHICSICKIESNGLKAWHGHLRGMRHTKAKAEFLKLSTSHDESYASRRGPRPGKRPYSSERSSGDLSSSDRFHHSPLPSTRVVVAKFPMGSVAVADLLGLGKPFGKVVKHLLFPFKGFLEFSSHREAKDMVTHYQHKPAYIKGNFISLSLSPNVKVIHDPTDFHEPGPKRAKSVQSVVCFSRLPPGKVNEDKVLELAGLFGDVRNSKFTEEKALIEMVNWRDADIMVKYYHSNPLRIQDKSIKVYLSSLTSLREGSSERSSRRSDSGRSRSSRPKSESSSKSTAQSSSKDRDKEKEVKEGEEGEKDKEKTEGEKVDKKEEMLEHEQEVQTEDESSMMETDEAGAIGTGMEKQEEKKDCMETDVEKTAEEEQCEEQKMNKEKQGSVEDAEEQEDLEAMDFPDNLDDFVTLDELDPTSDSPDSPEFPDGKVVLVKPIMFVSRVDHRSTMIKDLYKLAAPFGKVVNFAISYYKHEAMLELETQEQAREMVSYYRGIRTKLRGRRVSITINPSVKTIEDPSGRTLFIRNIPRFGNLEMPLLKTIRPFGKITGYSFSCQYGTCYVQMEKVEAAKLVIDRYTRYPLKFSGVPLKITKCKKGDSLIFWNSADIIEHWYESQQSKKSERRRENGQTSKGSTGEGRHSSRLEGVCGDPSADDSEEDEMNQAPLSPFEPNKPVGVSYVVSRTGFFCKLCNIFYTDEKRAKSDHCSSLEHYNMLKKKHERVKSKPLPDTQVIMKEEDQTEMHEEEQQNEQVEEEQVDAPEDEQQKTLEEEQQDEQREAQEEEWEEAQEDTEAQEEEEQQQQQEEEEDK